MNWYSNARYPSEEAVAQRTRAEKSLVTTHPHLKEVLSTMRFLQKKTSQADTYNSLTFFARVRSNYPTPSLTLTPT